MLGKSIMSSLVGGVVLSQVAHTLFSIMVGFHSVLNIYVQTFKLRFSENLGYFILIAAKFQIHAYSDVCPCFLTLVILSAWQYVSTGTGVQLPSTRGCQVRWDMSDLAGILIPDMPSTTSPAAPAARHIWNRNISNIEEVLIQSVHETGRMTVYISSPQLSSMQCGPAIK